MSDRMSPGQCAANLRVLRRAVNHRDLDPDDDQRTLLYLADIADELLSAIDGAKQDAIADARAKLREAVRRG